MLDASAILAFAQGEAGADIIEEQLLDGARCGTASWSEVAQKILASGRDWELVRALLVSCDLRLEAVEPDDAEWAAQRWRNEGLSLGDRLCLALAHRLGADVWTADAAWGTKAPVRQIR